MTRHYARAGLGLVVLLGFAACSSDSGGKGDGGSRDGAAGGGGATGATGGAGTGGSGSGGATASGGATGSGGRNETGGAVGSGGVAGGAGGPDGRGGDGGGAAGGAGGGRGGASGGTPGSGGRGGMSGSGGRGGAGSGGAGGSNMCGGLAGRTCPADRFCQLAVGTCRYPDAAGTCAIYPQACPANVDPVCGCNGVTYSNDCVRQSAGVSKLSDGGCNPSGCPAIDPTPGAACPSPNVSCKYTVIADPTCFDVFACGTDLKWGPKATACAATN